MAYKRSFHSNQSFFDMLFNILLIFVCLFMIAFLQISVENKDKNIKTNAEFIATLTWDAECPDDVDIWIRDPFGQVLWFRNKDVGMMQLDRDDVGHKNDYLELPDGTSVMYHHNQEIATIRGIIPGEWTVNVHMYNKHQLDPAHVEVKIEKLNPKVTTVAYKKVTLLKKWEEKTIARFFVDKDGKVKDLNNVFRSIVLYEILKTIPGSFPTHGSTNSH